MTYAFIALGLAIGFFIGAKATHSVWRARYYTMREEALISRAALLTVQRELDASLRALIQEWAVK